VSTINVPNVMTTFRALLTIPLVYHILNEDVFLSLLIFTLGVLSDADGFVARILKQETKFGAFYDVAADSIFGVGAMAALIVMQKVPFLLLSLLLIVNIPRFLIISRMHKTGISESSFLSKLSGMLALFIIPLGIIDFIYLSHYIISVIVLTVIILGKKILKQSF